jgi:hypothetical protein
LLHEFERTDDVLRIFGRDACADVGQIGLLAQDTGDDDCVRKAVANLVATQTDVAEGVWRDSDDADGVGLDSLQSFEDGRGGSLCGKDVNERGRGKEVRGELAGDLIGEVASGYAGDEFRRCGAEGLGLVASTENIFDQLLDVLENLFGA